MEMGRHKTILVESLPEGWQQKLFDLAKQGASIKEMRVELGLVHSSFYRLLDDCPEFKEFIEELRDVAQVWWERQGRRFVTENNSGGQTAWIFQMKNRFPDDYRDRKEIDHQSTDGTLTPVSKVTIEVIDATQNQSDQASS